MCKKIFLNSISFLILALMFVKVSALHVYSHQDTDKDPIENCNICDWAYENQHTEFLLLADFSTDFLDEIAFEVKSILSNSLEFSSTELHFYLFGRPPPTLV